MILKKYLDLGWTTHTWMVTIRSRNFRTTDHYRPTRLTQVGNFVKVYGLEAYKPNFVLKTLQMSIRTLGQKKEILGGSWSLKNQIGFFFAIILWTSGQKKQFGFSGSFQKIFGLWARQAKHENFMITLNGLGTDKQNLAGCNSSKQAFGLGARLTNLEILLQ